jgi:ribosomal protein S18 acetylase RimI-like enzyme
LHVGNPAELIAPRFFQGLRPIGIFVLVWGAALSGKLSKHVPDGSPGSIRTVAVDPQFGGQFVGSLEADAPADG